LLIPVILAGGVGSRLWPLSRDHYPKQFIPLIEKDCSLLQSTLKRITGIADIAAPLVVCNNDHRFLVAEQLRQLNINNAGIILEPAAKNTAPAAALAAIKALAVHEDPVLLVLPADHLITNNEQFHRTIKTGAEQAENGNLVTFGVTPTRPETGYGYIRRKKTDEQKAAYPVDSFVEKPDLETAKQYVESGDYYWNSGMFIFKASVFLDELKAHAPDVLDICQQAYKTLHKDLDFDRISEQVFNQCRSVSIDYAVMEKTNNAVVVPFGSEWNDVGAWSAIWGVSQQDADGNAVLGDVILEDVTNSYIRSETRLVTGLGIDNMVVVETADAVLVANKDKVQNVKLIVEALKRKARNETIEHARVYRPWGSYESIISSQRFQAKNISVKPGASLSLQLHHHRAEHWIVVKGCALVTRGEEEFQLNEDESTYIPIGTRHRLTNPGVIPLELIEVQTGSYLGEDDIVRLEDIYGRNL
jgi:mannose-1-phosphate guanylyltransferase/mannose-6-phosphate isomerase